MTDKTPKCPRCHGSGKVAWACDQGHYGAEETCSDCGGTGLTAPSAASGLAERLEEAAYHVQQGVGEPDIPHPIARLLKDAATSLRSRLAQGDAILVPIATLDRIMRDCEHGSRIWKECDALARQYRIDAAMSQQEKRDG